MADFTQRFWFARVYGHVCSLWRLSMASLKDFLLFYVTMCRMQLLIDLCIPVWPGQNRRTQQCLVFARIFKTEQMTTFQQWFLLFVVNTSAKIILSVLVYKHVRNRNLPLSIFEKIFRPIISSCSRSSCCLTVPIPQPAAQTNMKILELPNFM